MHFMVLGTLVFFLILFAVVFFTGIGSYNSLVSSRNQVDRAWANIDVILKQRHDLIPQLLTICEQYAQYERGTLDRIVEARKNYGLATTVNDKIKASAELTQALRGIFALAESYPELKSSGNFVELEKAVKEMENQLADRRELYNETATNFNTRCAQFPDMFFASLLRYATIPLYKVEDSEKTAPSLQMKLPA